MEQVILRGTTYTWSAPLDGLLGAFRINEVPGFDGVIVDAYSVPDLNQLDDLYLPLCDGPIRVSDLP